VTAIPRRSASLSAASLKNEWLCSHTSSCTGSVRPRRASSDGHEGVELADLDVEVRRGALEDAPTEIRLEPVPDGITGDEADEPLHRRRRPAGVEALADDPGQLVPHGLRVAEPGPERGLVQDHAVHPVRIPHRQ
jgi:hypothetical protein